MNDRTFKKVITELEAAHWIETTEDKNSKLYADRHIKQSKKLKSYTGGYIIFYFSAAVALIDGRISQTAYKAYLTLTRNLSNSMPVTYDELCRNLGIGLATISERIHELAEAKCIIIEKRLNQQNRIYNHYIIC
jgi:hypothetical protein